jgi:hypothetical protein
MPLLFGAFESGLAGATDAEDAPGTPDAEKTPKTQEREYTDGAAYAGDTGVGSARPARRETPSVGIQPVNSRFLHVMHLTSFVTGTTSVKDSAVTGPQCNE